MSITAIMSGLVIEAATTTAVDVVTRRSVDPKIRFAGKTWKTFSLADKVVGVENAIRISAYSDAAGIVANELVVQKISKEAISALPEINAVNFELIQLAGELLIHPDFVRNPLHDPSVLNSMNYAREENAEFSRNDYEGHGGELLELVEKCLQGAARANFTVLNLLKNDECSVPRRKPLFGWEPTWVDKINTGLGYALWMPQTAIGVGRGYALYGDYQGTFNKECPEGYGKISLNHNDGIYRGQVRDGVPLGYGVVEYPDGRLFAGFTTPNERDLGVVLSPERDKAVFGASVYGQPRGFCRQIGLSKGVGSVSGYWNDGQLSLEVSTQADTHQRLYESYNRPNLLGEDFVSKMRETAKFHNQSEENVDNSLISLIRSF